jgi:hypothetical protein
MTDQDAPELKFKYYDYAEASGYVLGVEPTTTAFTFDPRPTEGNKNIKRVWRKRHSGRRRFEKAKNRQRETTTFRYRGSMPKDANWMELERMATDRSRSWYLHDPMLVKFYDQNQSADHTVVIIDTLNIKLGQKYFGNEKAIDYDMQLTRVLPHVSQHFRSGG